MEDPGIHPIYDAVGRAVESAANLEMWLTLLASDATGLTFERAARDDTAGMSKRILGAIALVALRSSRSSTA